MPGGTQTPGLRFMGLGLELAAGVIGFTLFGLWLDRRFDSSPWCLLCGLAIGLIGGLYNLVREVTARRDTGGPGA